MQVFADLTGKQCEPHKVKDVFIGLERVLKEEAVALDILKRIIFYGHRLVMLRFLQC